MGGYEMPAVIQLTTGDTIILRNDDTVPHMILYAFLMPGETHERTLTMPGSEVYSSGCGLHGASSSTSRASSSVIRRSSMRTPPPPERGVDLATAGCCKTIPLGLAQGREIWQVKRPSSGLT